MMGIFNDVLLTADYDRTLTDPEGKIPQRNLDAIRYFMDNGGSFTVNTGRSLPLSADILRSVPMNAPFLCYNGSLTIQDGVIMDQYTIDLPLVETLRSVCRAFPDLNVDLHGLHAHVGFQPVGRWQEYYAAQNCDYYLAEEREDYGPFLKFNVYGALHGGSFYQAFSGAPEEIIRVDEAAQWLQDTYGDKITVFRAGARVLNIHAKGVSKIRAARELQARLKKKFLICVGDAENDLPMLEGADYAFCPSDGTIADRFSNVCPCGDGAVADVIYEKIPEILKG